MRLPILIAALQGILRIRPELVDRAVDDLDPRAVVRQGAILLHW